MLMPKKVKYRKQQRGRMTGKAWRGSSLAFGDYGLKVMRCGWITDRQIEAARVAMTRSIKRGGKVWIRLFPDKPITKKPAETRMGKGKGAPEAVGVRGAARARFCLKWKASLGRLPRGHAAGGARNCRCPPSWSRATTSIRGIEEHMKENADKARAWMRPRSTSSFATGAEQAFRLRFQMSMGQAEGMKKLRSIRKERARMLTILRERGASAAARAGRGDEGQRREGAAPKKAAPKTAAPKTAAKTVQARRRAKDRERHDGTKQHSNKNEKIGAVLASRWPKPSWSKSSGACRTRSTSESFRRRRSFTRTMKRARQSRRCGADRGVPAADEAEALGAEGSGSQSSAGNH